MDAVRTIRRELDGRVPLIGFSGSPWTLATYMVEGSSSKDFATIKAMLYERPELLDQLLDTVSRSVALYLNAQIEAGAQTVMIFDTWGGALTPADYCRFSLQPMERIIRSLKRENDGRKVPVILFTKNGGQWLEAMADTGAPGIFANRYPGYLPVLARGMATYSTWATAFTRASILSMPEP